MLGARRGDNPKQIQSSDDQLHCHSGQQDSKDYFGNNQTGGPQPLCLLVGAFDYAIFANIDKVAAARTTIELRLTKVALDKESKRQRESRSVIEMRVTVLAKDVPQEIYSLPEIRKPKEDWYWAIYFGYYGEKVSNIKSTIAFKGDLSVADLFNISRVASVVHISAIVRDVLAYVDRGEPNGLRM